jgi:catechol 2,3-dioxygenase-like lactoylglutathione lyase family enzyme
MALHGIAEITVGVPNVDATRAFYREFGLDEREPGRFSSSDGGEQLRIVERPSRRLAEFVVGADDIDDIARVRRAAHTNDVDVTEHSDGSIALVEPLTCITTRVAVRSRITPVPYATPAMNTPGYSPRTDERAPAIFESGPARPRRLGHVLYGTPDLQASQRFLTDVLGFRLTDSSPGIISFLRCSSDHHNVGLMNAPIGFFHHSSWQVNDVDEIGKGAQNLLAVDPTRSVWGLGRHFLGSNLFWYFRDPAGNFAEYYSDLDQIVDDDAWVAREWEPDKSLYAWGPPVPLDFVSPPDLAELAVAR